MDVRCISPITTVLLIPGFGTVQVVGIEGRDRQNK